LETIKIPYSLLGINNIFGFTPLNMDFTKSFEITNSIELITECGISIPCKSDDYISFDDNRIIHDKALWDTGATHTWVSKSLIKRLNLQPLGSTEAESLEGVGKYNYYRVNLYLPNDVYLFNQRVIEFKDDIGSKYKIIIGMNIISLGNFSINRTDSGINMRFDISHL